MDGMCCWCKCCCISGSCGKTDEEKTKFTNLLLYRSFVFQGEVKVAVVSMLYRNYAFIRFVRIRRVLGLPAIVQLN